MDHLTISVMHNTLRSPSSFISIIIQIHVYAHLLRDNFFVLSWSPLANISLVKHTCLPLSPAPQQRAVLARPLFSIYMSQMSRMHARTSHPPVLRWSLNQPASQHPYKHIHHIHAQCGEMGWPGIVFWYPHTHVIALYTKQIYGHGRVEMYMSSNTYTRTRVYVCAYLRACVKVLGVHNPHRQQKCAHSTRALRHMCHRRRCRCPSRIERAPRASTHFHILLFLFYRAPAGRQQRRRQRLSTTTTTTTTMKRPSAVVLSCRGSPVPNAPKTTFKPITAERWAQHHSTSQPPTRYRFILDTGRVVCVLLCANALGSRVECVYTHIHARICVLLFHEYVRVCALRLEHVHKDCGPTTHTRTCARVLALYPIT